MSSLIDAKSFLPKAVQTDALFDELADNIQHELNQLDVTEDMIYNKYRDFESTTAVLQEMGLGYMLTLMEESGTNTGPNNLRAFAHAIRYYKGTKFGLELVISSLKLSEVLSTGRIVEWWEDEDNPGQIEPDPNLRRAPNTASILIGVATGSLPAGDVRDAFEAFLPHYVLPYFSYTIDFIGTIQINTEVVGAVHREFIGTVSD